MKNSFILKSFFILCALVVGSGSAWGQTTWSHSFASGELSTSAGNKTLSNVSWTQTAATYIGWDSNNGRGIQIGSSNNATTSFSLSTSVFSNYTITSISVNSSIASSGTAKMSIKVGSTTYLSQQVLSTSASTYSCTPNASGDIEISWSNTSKAFYLKSISVTYTTGSGPTTYTVTYASNGGTGSMTDSNSPYTAGATVTLLANTFTAPSGKVWSSWSVKDANNSTVTVTDGKFTMPASNVTVTAQWADAPTYTVTFDAGDGTFVGNEAFPNTSNTKTAGSYTLPSATPPSGYTFEGWVLTGNNTPLTGSYTVSANVDFTAQYSQGVKHTYSFAGANNFYTDANKTTHPSTGSGNNVGTIYYGDGSVFVASGDSRYFSSASSGYFMLGKTNAAISLPTFTGYKITQVKFHSSSSHSTNVSVSIVSGNNTASAAQTWSTKDQDYTYNIGSDYQATALSVRVTNDYNTQFTSITLVCEATSTDPIISATAPAALAYNATEGEFGYSITFPTEASLNATSKSDWITNVTVDGTNSKVTFSTSANTGYTQRTGTITLSYEGAEDKDITITQEAVPAPTLAAEDVEIAYDATGGSIAYTLGNPASDGALSAEVTEGNWLTLGNGTASPISFTNAANAKRSVRTAKVTLTYTYNTNQTVTKVVTVTQAGDPDALDNISDINTSAEYVIVGTVVATNARGFIIGDGTGYLNYYKGSAPTQGVGDKVKMSGTTSTSYGHLIQYTSSATINTSATSNYDGTPAATVITAVPDYSTGLHLSTYLQFEGTLSKSNSNYFIAVGNSQIQIAYPTTAQGVDLDDLDEKTVLVKGFFSGINSNSKFTVTLESVEEVENPIINASNVDLAFDATSGEIAYMVSNPVANVNLGASTTADWISNIVVASDKVTFTTTANDGDEDRVADVTLTYTGATNKVITVTQAHYVPDFATLPFIFDSNKGCDDIEVAVGLTQEGLGSDYKSAPLLKFDSAGDVLILKINEIPGTLTFDIKGNTFSDGTFKVQTSVDGSSYSDLQEYTDYLEDNNIHNESFDLSEEVRYIKWIYVTKDTGNVGLGNIRLSKPAGNAATVLSESKYVTSFYDSAKNYQLSEGALAYTVGLVNGTAVFYRIGGSSNIIPAGNAVIVISDVANIKFTVISAVPEGTTVHSGNILSGTNSEMTKPAGTVYVLGIDNEGAIGFYKLKDGSTIPAHKAYYVAE